MDGRVGAGKTEFTNQSSGTLGQQILGQYLPTMAKLGLLPTPKAREANDSPSERKRNQPSMETLAATGMLPTPAANDSKNDTFPPAAKTWDSVPGWIMRNSQTGTNSQQLNPRFVQEMMGFPQWWLVSPFQNGADRRLRRMAMLSSRKWRTRFSRQYKKH